MIENFLKQFYKIISFEAGENFKSDEFRNLFYRNALLIEKDEDQVLTKTVDQHIEEFENAVEHYPQLFVRGFKEESVSFQVLSSSVDGPDKSNYILVKSDYKKSYTRHGEAYSEEGSNMMTLVADGNSLKIYSIAW